MTDPSGGIDLSVGSVIAFTGRVSAKVIGASASPLALPLVLVMGCAFGAFMGFFDRRLGRSRRLLLPGGNVLLRGQLSRFGKSRSR